MRTVKKLMSKKERIKKALISIPTLTLQPEEADRFLDYVIDESVLKNAARIIKMTGTEKNIRAIGLGSGQILHPADTFTQADYKKEFGHNKITLSTKKARGCVVLYDDDLEDIQVIESDDAFTDQIMRMISAQIAMDLDEAAWIADTAGLGGFANTDIRSMWDGWRYIITHSASGQTYYNDVSGAAKILDATADFALAGKIAEQNAAAPYNWEFKFSKTKRSLPSKYRVKGGLKNLRFICSDEVVQDYIDALAARSTILGDAAILGKEEGLQFGMIPIAPCPLMPTTLDASGVLDAGNYTDLTLTHFQNFIIGLQREIKIETERVAADEANYFFYSIRADFKIENVNAIVMTQKMTIG